MTFDKTKDYTIQDAGQANVIELKSIKPLENWYKGEIKSQKLTSSLENQFKEIEQFIKSRDFKSVQKIESEIISKQLIIKEIGQTLSEIQMGKKNTIYFKINGL